MRMPQFLTRKVDGPSLSRAERNLFNKELLPLVVEMKFVDPVLFNELITLANEAHQLHATLDELGKPFFKEAAGTQQQVELTKKEMIKFSELIDDVFDTYRSQVNFYKEFHSMAIKLNNISDESDRETYRQSLKRWFEDNKLIGDFDAMRRFYEKFEKEFDSDKFAAFMLKNGFNFNING